MKWAKHVKHLGDTTIATEFW